MDQIELEELLTELNKVIDWFSFGINLEIPEARLKEIEQKYESVESCKREMLTVWMQLTHPTWKAIVIALAGINMKDLALKIATKYGKTHYINWAYLPPSQKPTNQHACIVTGQGRSHWYGKGGSYLTTFSAITNSKLHLFFKH